LVDQRDQGLEVILIDTSTNDASIDIANSFSDKLRIRTERRPDLLPWEKKANYGVSQAHGDRICILHQDDYWLTNRCAMLRDWIVSQADAVMHLPRCYIVNEAGRRLGLWRCPLPNGQLPVPTHILLARLLIQNFIAIPAPTIRRDAYLRVGGLDEGLWYTQD